MARSCRRLNIDKLLSGRGPYDGNHPDNQQYIDGGSSIYDGGEPWGPTHPLPPLYLNPGILEGRVNLDQQFANEQADQLSRWGRTPTGWESSDGGGAWLNGQEPPNMRAVGDLIGDVISSAESKIPDAEGAVSSATGGILCLDSAKVALLPTDAQNQIQAVRVPPPSGYPPDAVCVPKAIVDGLPDDQKALVYQYLLQPGSPGAPAADPAASIPAIATKWPHISSTLSMVPAAHQMSILRSLAISEIAERQGVAPPGTTAALAATVHTVAKNGCQIMPTAHANAVAQHVNALQSGPSKYKGHKKVCFKKHKGVLEWLLEIIEGWFGMTNTNNTSLPPVMPYGVGHLGHRPYVPRPPYDDWSEYPHELYPILRQINGACCASCARGLPCEGKRSTGCCI